jgi:hypothetical protein
MLRFIVSPLSFTALLLLISAIAIRHRLAFQVLWELEDDRWEPSIETLIEVKLSTG